MSLNTHYHVAKYLTISLASLGFLLNLLTLLALCCVKKFTLGPHLILLKSLTTADMLVALQLVLHKVLIDYGHCYAVTLLYPCSPFYTSTFITLVLIAINLYIAIAHPLHHNQIVTRKRTTVAVILCWTFGLLVYSTDVIRSLVDHLKGVGDFCFNFYNYRSGFFVSPQKYLHTFEWSWMILMALVYVGLVFITVLYLRIYWIARKSLKSMPGLPSAEISQRREKRKSIYTSLLLLGTFLSVYVPVCLSYTIFQAYKVKVYGAGTGISQIAKVYNYLEIYTEPILVINVLCDPLIYVVRMKSIRHGYKKLFCCICQKFSMT